MSDLLVDSPPNKRPKLEDPFQGSSDSSGVYSSNEMFDLENDLPDELISATPWNQQPDIKPNLGPQVPLQNGMIVQQNNPQQLQQPIQPRLVVSQHQLAHHFMGSTKHLVTGAGMSMNNKPINPNMPSPNVLVGKTGEPMVVNMGNAGINSNQLQNSISGINVANVNIMMGNNLVNNSMHNPHHGIPQQQQNGPMMGRNIPMHHPQQIRNQTPHQLHNLPINSHRLQAPMGAMSPVNNFNAYNQNNQQINVVQQQSIGIVRQQVPRFNSNTNGMLVDTPVPPQSQANLRLGPQQVNMVNQNVVVPPQGVVPADRSQANPEKRKMITQQLVLLLHAHQCQRRDNQQANGEVRQCRLQHCNTMKGVLAHMTNCLAGRNCNVAHCSSSRQIISHWKQCTRPDCPICQPLKASNNRNALANNPTQNTTGMNDMNCYNTVNNQVNQVQVQGVPNNVGIRTALQSQMPHPPNNNVLTPNQNTRVLVPHSQPQVTTSMSVADPSPSSVNEMLQSVSNTTVPVPSSIQQSVSNIPNSFIMTTSTDTMTTQMNNQAQPSQSMPGNHIESKEWHESITPELRNHLVHKLVQAIFPTYDPKAMLDKRMNNLVAYARKVEGDMYNVANSRSEYYHRLAQTFYKIQKELEEKMQKRKEQQQMQQQQMGTPQPTNNINAQCFPTVSTQGLPPTQQQPPQPQQQQPLHHTSIQPSQQNLPQVVTTTGIMKTQMSDRVHFPITSPVPGPSPNTNLPQTTFGLTQPPAQSPINTSQFPSNSPMMPNISQGSFAQPQFPNQSMNQIPQQIHIQQQVQQQQQQQQTNAENIYGTAPGHFQQQQNGLPPPGQYNNYHRNNMILFNQSLQGSLSSVSSGDKKKRNITMV
uniref:histone acetyltransferase n=1 Tax=Melanaphis sacchari TaxID=742174 RepID=A0A2H8TG07_9HEMI